MSIRHIETGARMSEAVIHGNTVYLAGQVGEAGASVTVQTQGVLAEIDRLLALAGSHKSKLLQVTVWLDDIADFDEMNAVWDAWVDPVHKPGRATGQAHLMSPDYKVEMIAIAAID